MELNAAATVQGTLVDGQCLQYVADNVDHNITTLDGRGIVHGMGIISIVTPSPAKRATVIHRKNADIRDAGNIKILHHPSGHNCTTYYLHRCTMIYSNTTHETLDLD